eukprot:CAMPEP_0195522724 /NCGR_PEP_ID=MMETSP0794_2-20130614/21178_1 /TAXON_ID=515487 /ORGANISM="Stephanopyxis turris, Strain CCMP 815" /LENGTH=435 /DNA_ID=CAMNT_0040652553 /DNA_START=25 /DNA_END=1332 /DNA_ORIENTATION=+
MRLPSVSYSLLISVVIVLFQCIWLLSYNDNMGSSVVDWSEPQAQLQPEKIQWVQEESTSNMSMANLHTNEINKTISTKASTSLPKSNSDDTSNQQQEQQQQRKHEDKNSNEDKVKIVAFTDLTYAPVAKWWYERMTNLSYTTHTLILIDAPAVEHFTSIKNSSRSHYRFETQIVDNGKRRKNKVRSLWYNRILYSLNQLKSNQSLLLTDVDNVFMRYEPLSNFYDSNYDAIFALEGKFPAHIFDQMGFVLCGGMTFLKSTNATIQVMEKLLEMCDGGTKRCDDQVEWNNMLAKDMNWNSSWARHESRLVGGDMVQYGFEGVNRAFPDFKAKVWDRDFAWRGGFSTDVRCPSLETNWVAMPYNLPHDVMEDLKQFHETQKGIFGDIAKEKLARIHIWAAFCGTNGTQRVSYDGKKSGGGGVRNTLYEAVEVYKATL